MIIKFTKWIFRDVILDILAIVKNIQAVLLAILKEQKTMTADINQVDTALSTLSTIVLALAADFQAYIAKVPPSPDFQPELDKVNSTIAALQALDAQLQPAPAPAPADTVTAATGTDTPADATGTDASIPQ